MIEQLKLIQSDVTLIKKLLTGNGDPAKGLVVRVDRIEQREKSRSKLSATAITTCIVTVITMLIRMLVLGH